MTTALNGICGMCTNDLAGRPPHFFLPIPDRTGQTNKSKEVCPECFSKFLEDNVPDTVTVQSGPDMDHWTQENVRGSNRDSEMSMNPLPNPEKTTIFGPAFNEGDGFE